MRAPTATPPARVDNMGPNAWAAESALRVDFELNRLLILLGVLSLVAIPVLAGVLLGDPFGAQFPALLTSAVILILLAVLQAATSVKDLVERVLSGSRPRRGRRRGLPHGWYLLLAGLAFFAVFVAQNTSPFPFYGVALALVFAFWAVKALGRNERAKTRPAKLRPAKGRAGTTGARQTAERAYPPPRLVPREEKEEAPLPRAG
jgi:uncharacterized membrane protein YhaH (DUF805 family)